MAGIYGVTAADVEAELPGLVPVGFTQATKPSLDTVTLWIADADTFIDSVIRDALARIDAAGALDAAPGTTDRFTQFAKRYIVADVVARVLRATYAGKANAADLTALLASYGGASVLAQIEAEVTQAIENIITPPSVPEVAVPYTTAPRSLIVDDTDLDPNSGFRGRW
jgi:hypothetical protein